MRRPTAAREALGFSPLIKAGGAHSTRVERVPLMTTGARQEVFLAGRPTAEWAPDARAGRAEAFFLVEFAIQNNGR